jgi:predicted ATP-grasp superfamily ATP-dependent carboligase
MQLGEGLLKARGRVAFVLGMETATGLGIVRSLGRRGVACVGVGIRGELGLGSRYCKPVFSFDPVERARDALEVLLDEGKKYPEKGILYQTTDEHVLFISRFRKELSASFLFAIPSEDVVESMLNKRRLYEVAEKVGISYPKTYYAENIDEVMEISNEVEFPAFIKPCWSHLWRRSFRGKGFKVNRPDELVEKYKQIFKAKQEALVQSIVTGPDSNITEVHAYLSAKCDPQATFVSRKLRQHPNNFGIGTCHESIHDQEALEIALKFYRNIRYRGLGHLELKRDDRDGKYKLLELNLRLGTHSILPTCAGVNFPLIQYLDLSGRSIGSIDYKDSVMWLDASMDFLSARELWKVYRTFSLSAWFHSIRNVDCHAYFAADDLKPFFRRYLDLAVKGISQFSL